jgi:site-specific recombinase XerD
VISGLRETESATLNSWVIRWLTHAGVPRRAGALAHSFRHTAADGWLDNAATLAEVQALLGHASIATTGIYTKARPDTLRQVTAHSRYEQARSLMLPDALP